MSKRSFASDNNAGVHPEMIEAIRAANDGHVVAYGDDPFTERAVKVFQKHFGKDIAVYFVFGGTGANVLGLKAMTNSYEAVVCAETAHINVDECGAPEKFAGCKLLSLRTPDGKLRVEQIKPLLHGVGFEHHVQPRVISVSQATEMGTVYTKNEFKTLARFAHDNNMLLHVDGARIANAVASLNANLKEITVDAGVDVLSFGGAKNGMMYGEAVVFFNQQLGENFKYIRKQGMHLPSKMRFISAQFEALLSGDLWRRSATHANRMARVLASELEKVPAIKLTQPVEANGVFAVIPEKHVEALQKKYFFYVWNEETSECRFMASFDTTEEDIKDFVALVRKIVK
ncbi:MAG: low specificity L-threonine aldolase [Acidobacteria bacterium]|nr:low specificity L-threonine aldolase [Acidobacteriota bacterium]MCA1627633.1 low specificity L-threonine aldolase [Acidobacteriota bacterium]